MEPKYINSEQYKFFKEKGYTKTVDRTSSFSKRSWAEEFAKGKNGEILDDNSYDNDGKVYTVYYQEKIVPFSIEPHHLVEWLRVNHGIWVRAEGDNYGEYWFAKLSVCSKKVWENLELRTKILKSAFYMGEYRSPQEAYSAAFDYIKDKELI